MSVVVANEKALWLDPVKLQRQVAMIDRMMHGDALCSPSEWADLEEVGELLQMILDRPIVQLNCRRMEEEPCPAH